MDAIPDYSKCSLRELGDVAARINREKYPERYAAVLQEIELRESQSEVSVPATPKRVPTAWGYFTIALAFVGGAAVGLIICSVASPVRGVSDVPKIGEVFAMAIGFFGGGIACAQWRLRTIEKR